MSGVEIKPAKPPLHIFLITSFLTFFHDLGRSVCEIISDLMSYVLLFTGRFIGFIWTKTENARTFLLGKLKYAGIFIFSPLFKLVGGWQDMRRDVKAANREHGMKGALPAFFRHLFKFIFGKRGAAVTVFNYALPVISVVFLVGVVSYATDTEYAVRLEVNGRFIGYIENELVFSEAEKIYEERLYYRGSEIHADIFPRFTIEKVGYSEILSTYRVADILLERSGAVVEYAYGVIINGEFMGAVLDNSRLLETREALLNVHRTGIADEVVDFHWEVNFSQGGMYPVESIRDPQVIIRNITRNSQDALFYTVVEGDDHELVTDKLAMSMLELERLNPGFSEMTLSEGSRIKYSAEEPFIPVTVTRTEVYDQEIPFTIEYRDDSSLFTGTQNTSREGTPGYNRVTARVTLLNGVENGRVVIDTVPVSDPVNRIILRGTGALPQGQFSTQPGVDGKFIWPVPPSYPVTEWHREDGGYWGHSGVDIGAPYGTPIFAGASGTVVSAGWLYDYGLTVVLEHDNGLRTLYAHASALNVTAGQSVSLGETVAFVGQTGKADGNHVHFEVRESGRILNPRHYLIFS